jgi:tetratricopeptide (TPR) repeat protein
MQMQRWSFVIFATWMALPLAAAHAQDVTDEAEAEDAQASRDEEARARFEAGRLAYASSRYADALSEFEHAYELSGRPELLYNMGQCFDRLRRDADAIETFERYLRELPAASNRIEVETRLEVLRAAARERAVVTLSPELLTTEAPPPAAGGVETEWWFWAALGGGALVVGAVVAILVATTSTTSTDPLYAGDVGPGGIVVALEGP